MNRKSKSRLNNQDGLDDNDYSSKVGSGEASPVSVEREIQQTRLRGHGHIDKTLDAIYSNATQGIGSSATQSNRHRRNVSPGKASAPAREPDMTTATPVGRSTNKVSAKPGSGCEDIEYYEQMLATAMETRKKAREIAASGAGLHEPHPGGDIAMELSAEHSSVRAVTQDMVEHYWTRLTEAQTRRYGSPRDTRGDM